MADGKPNYEPGKRYRLLDLATDATCLLLLPGFTPTTEQYLIVDVSSTSRWLSALPLIFGDGLVWLHI